MLSFLPIFKYTKGWLDAPSTPEQETFLEFTRTALIKFLREVEPEFIA